VNYNQQLVQSQDNKSHMYLSTRQNTRELGISHRHIIHNDLLLNRLNKRRTHEMTAARTISSCTYMYCAAVFWKVWHFWYYSMRTANFWLTRCRSYLDRLRSALKLFLSTSLYCRVFYGPPFINTAARHLLYATHTHLPVSHWLIQPCIVLTSRWRHQIPWCQAN